MPALPHVSDWIVLGRGLKPGIPHKFLGSAAAAGTGTTQHLHCQSFFLCNEMVLGSAFLLSHLTLPFQV